MSMTQKERSLEIGPECAFLNANRIESLRGNCDLGAH